MASIVIPDKNQFQHIIRLLNTNIDGKQKVMYALTSIKGVGRRYSNLVCKKADVDITKRAGELSNDELERLVTIIQNPTQYKIPNWFLNRQKDIKDGTYSQVLANGLDNKQREDVETLKKIRCHRGLRHYWQIRVRGQHTKTTGRRGKIVGVAKVCFPSLVLLIFSLEKVNWYVSDPAIHPSLFLPSFSWVALPRVLWPFVCVI